MFPRSPYLPGQGQKLKSYRIPYRRKCMARLFRMLLHPHTPDSGTYHPALASSKRWSLEEGSPQFAPIWLLLLPPASSPWSVLAVDRCVAQRLRRDPAYLDAVEWVQRRVACDDIIHGTQAVLNERRRFRPTKLGARQIANNACSKQTVSNRNVAEEDPYTVSAVERVLDKHSVLTLRWCRMGESLWFGPDPLEGYL